MTTVSASAVIGAVVTLLTEAYAGPPNPSSTWFIDNEPDCGILGVLSTETAAQASTSVDGSGGLGSTIAANAEHLRLSLGQFNAAILGESYGGSWKESWHLTGADEAQWEGLRSALRDEFETLRQVLSQQEELPEEYIVGTLAVVAHAAFHLGIIRQMAARVSSG